MALHEMDAVAEETPVSAVRLWVTRIVIGLLVLAVLAGIGYGIKKLFSGGATQKKQITTVKNLRRKHQKSSLKRRLKNRNPSRWRHRLRRT
jgi:hypothetical protein